ADFRYSRETGSMAFLRLLMAKRILGFAAASFIAAGHPQIAAPSPSAQQVQTFSTVDQTHVAKRPTSQGTSVVPASEVCPRPQPSSLVPEPADLRAENGALTVDFAFRSEIDAH